MLQLLCIALCPGHFASLGIAVMIQYTCLRGCEFESQHKILPRWIAIYILVFDVKLFISFEKNKN